MNAFKNCCDFHEGAHVANNKNSVIFIPRAGWIWICFSTHTRRLDATFNRLHILCKLTTHVFVCYVAPYIGCTFRHIFNEVLRMSTDYLPFQMRYNIRCKGLCKLFGTTKSSRQFCKQNVLVTFPVDESWFNFFDLSCRVHTLNQIWNIHNLRSPATIVLTIMLNICMLNLDIFNTIWHTGPNTMLKGSSEDYFGFGSTSVGLNKFLFSQTGCSRSKSTFAWQGTHLQHVLAVRNLAGAVRNRVRH